MTLELNFDTDNVLNFDVISSGSIFIDIPIGNVKNTINDICFLYDSGATRTVLSNKDLEILGYEYSRLTNEADWLTGKYYSGLKTHNHRGEMDYVSPKNFDVRIRSTLANGTKALIVPVLLTSINIAGVDFKYFPVLTYYKTEEEIEKDSKKKITESNLLGTDILRYFQNYTDYDNERLILVKRESFEALLAEAKRQYHTSKIYDNVMIHSLKTEDEFGSVSMGDYPHKK